jgi:hypothetical protein
MARLVYETQTKTFWLTTLADPAEPTVAEIAAGVAFSPFMAKDGLAVNISTNNVDSATIDDSFDAQLAGSWGADVKLTLFRDDENDDAWDACVYGTNGWLVISRTGAPIATSVVEVWPAQMHQPAMENSGSNAQQRFVESFAITGIPTMDAIVAAA